MPPVRVNYNNLIYNEFTYGREREREREREAKSVRFSD